MANYEIIVGDDVGAITSNNFVVNSSSYRYKALTSLDIANANSTSKTIGDTAMPSSSALFCSDSAQIKECVRKDTVSYLTNLFRVDFTNKSGYYPTSFFTKLGNSPSTAAKLLIGSTSVVKLNGIFYPNYHVTSNSYTYSLYGTGNSWDFSDVYLTSITAYTGTNITIHDNDMITSFRANGNSTFAISGCTNLATLYLATGAKVSSVNVFSGCTKLKSIAITSNPYGTTGIISNAAVNYGLLPSGGHVSINWNDPNGTGTFYFDSNCYYKYDPTGQPTGGGFYVGDYILHAEGSGGWSELFNDKGWTLSNSGDEYAGGGYYY